MHFKEYKILALWGLLLFYTNFRIFFYIKKEKETHLPVMSSTTEHKNQRKYLYYLHAFPKKKGQNQSVIRKQYPSNSRIHY